MESSSRKAQLRGVLNKRVQDWWQRPDSLTRDQADQQICQGLWNLCAQHKIESVAGYVALSSEPDLHSFFELWLAAGKALYLPRVSAKGLEFLPCSYLELNNSELWFKNFLGIRELKESRSVFLPSVVAHKVDLILVPGLGFSESGHRLGRGGGYYDRALAEMADVEVLKIGVSYSPRTLTSADAEFPFEEHDQKVNKILTEKGVFSCS